MNNRKLLPLIIIGVIAIFIIAGISSSLFYTVQADERAVIFYKFGIGLDKDNTMQPGFHMKAPWNEVYIYAVRENSAEENMDVLDKNGLSLHIDITVRFHPFPEMIGYIHERFNRNYVNILVIPEIRSTVRQVMGRYNAEEIYSTKRAEVEAAIETESELILAENNVRMIALLIRSIELPEQIRMAIQNKLEQEQEALAYQFRLQREQSEAERRRIQAEGEAAANKIINSSLTRSLLQMRGIEATLQLSQSPNSKVVIVGSGEGGLPLILGGN